MNRRTLLAGLAAVAPATAVTAMPAAINPDAELLALGSRFDAAYTAEKLAWQAADTVYDEDEAHAAQDCTADIVERIAAIPAQTIDGVRVKARAYRRWIVPAQIDPNSDMLCDRMLLGLLDDLTYPQAATL